MKDPIERRYNEQDPRGIGVVMVVSMAIWAAVIWLAWWVTR
jgi:hypothetical protein